MVSLVSTDPLLVTIMTLCISGAFCYTNLRSMNLHVIIIETIQLYYLFIQFTFWWQFGAVDMTLGKACKVLRLVTIQRLRG